MSVVKYNRGFLEHAAPVYDRGRIRGEGVARERGELERMAVRESGALDGGGGADRERVVGGALIEGRACC